MQKACAHFNPKPFLIVKCYEFNTRCQGADERVATYVAELRKNAEFGLRDCLVCGILNKEVQRCLLQETELSFEKALEIALSAETVEKDSRTLNSVPGHKDQPAVIEVVKDCPTPRR